MSPYLSVTAGALGGAGVAAVVVGLGHAADQTTLLLLAGMVVGGLSARGLRSPPLPHGKTRSRGRGLVS